MAWPPNWSEISFRRRHLILKLLTKIRSFQFKISKKTKVPASPNCPTAGWPAWSAGKPWATLPMENAITAQVINLINPPAVKSAKNSAKINNHVTHICVKVMAWRQNWCVTLFNHPNRLKTSMKNKNTKCKQTADICKQIAYYVNNQLNYINK